MTEIPIGMKYLDAMIASATDIYSVITINANASSIDKLIYTRIMGTKIAKKLAASGKALYSVVMAINNIHCISSDGYAN